VLSVSGSSEARLHRDRCRELMVTQATTVVLGRRGFKKATTRHGWCVIIKPTMYHSGVAEHGSLLESTIRRVDRSQYLHLQNLQV